MKDSKDGKKETCYLCLKEFSMNKDDGSYYRYKKYPICDDCSKAYGFY